MTFPYVNSHSCIALYSSGSCDGKGEVKSGCGLTEKEVRNPWWWNRNVMESLDKRWGRKQEKGSDNGIIKVIMFQSEGCAGADQDVNAETIKMQITGLGGFGKWGVLPRHTLINSMCNPIAARSLPANTSSFYGLITEFVHGECLDRQSISPL